MGKFYERLAGGLIPYVRMLAWLQAVPNPPPGNTNLANREERDPRSRGKRFADDKKAVTLPAVEQGYYLIDHLLDAGPVISTGMGAVILTWQELTAWQAALGLVLDPWELRMIRQLSAEYLAESQRATAHDCPPPWSDEPTEAQRDRVALQLRQAFRARMNKDDDDDPPPLASPAPA